MCVSVCTAATTSNLQVLDTIYSSGTGVTPMNSDHTHVTLC